MHAVVIADGRLRWEERPDPEPGDTELIVDVRAAGVNGADLAQRRGTYPAPAGSPPDIPGLELAGEVVCVGRRVTRFAAGDRVMALVGGGAQSTRAVVAESQALAVPEALPWPEAGGFVEVFFTAFDALYAQAGLRLGDRVLVTGAAGGVGTAAVQLAAAGGASVVAAVRDPALRAAVADLGAERVVAPEEIGDHGPYDVVLELVGAAGLALALPALAVGGRVVVIGIGSGERLELDLLWLMRVRGRLAATTLRARSAAEKAALTVAVERGVLPLLAARRVRVPVCARFPMSEATLAYERFASGGKLGKVVLLNQNPDFPGE
jgi:NADPH:quinone reductase